MRCQFSLRVALALMVSASVFFSGSDGKLFEPPAANAAERVVLRYRIFRRAISVEELSTFARTGELSRSLRVNLALARQNPEVIRRYLSEPVKVNVVFLDRLLNSRIGNALLDEVSKAIYTPSRQANRQALRSALILSASRDGQITLLEVLQNYPTREVQVDGERLESTYRQLRRLGGRVQDVLERVR